jgi:hypothetical protein
LPQQMENVRTRIVEGTNNTPYGALSEAETTRGLQVSAILPSNPALSEAEFKRAQTVHSVQAAMLLKESGVQGVGISPSLDASGEAALMVFLIRGVAHSTIPPVIDGVRTRVRESSRFRANYSGISSTRSCHLPAKQTQQPKSEPKL